MESNIIDWNKYQTYELENYQPYLDSFNYLNSSGYSNGSVTILNTDIKQLEGINLEQFLETNKLNMNSLSTIAKKILPGQTKILLKAGYLDGELNPTAKGVKAMFTVLLEDDSIAKKLEDLATKEIEEEKEDSAE